MVKFTLEAVCILMETKPDWGEAKKLMSQMDFLEQLGKYDKDNILNKYRPDRDNPKKTIIWKDSFNSEKETPMTIRTLRNRLTPIIKYIKNKIH